MKTSRFLTLYVTLLLTALRSDPAHSQELPKDSLAPTPVRISDSWIPGLPATRVETLLELAREMDLGERLNPPQASIDGENFVYYEGDLPLVGDSSHSSREHPFLIPLARTIQIQTLRDALYRHDSSFWTPYFDLAYTIIDQQLALIACQGKDTRDLLDRLKSSDQQIAHTFRSSAPVAYAAAHGLRLKRPVREATESRDSAVSTPGLLSAIPRARQRHQARVLFNIDPRARLFVIPSTFFLMKGDYDFMWCEIPASDVASSKRPATLGGSYYYKVEWSDGATTAPTLIRVSLEGQVFAIVR